jgi:hypothetical protein
MPDVLLSNDDVTVLGPPNTVEVLVDIGPTGTRGSQVFVGVGDPNVFPIGQTPLLNDLYINASPGADYGYMYQYVSEPGGNTWIQILEISPTLYSQLHTTTYVDGVAQVVIPISNIVTVTGSPLASTNFVVQYSIAHSNPTASSVVVPALVGAGTNLVLDFSAVEYTGSVWQNLDEEVTTHLFISIVLDEES